MIIPSKLKFLNEVNKIEDESVKEKLNVLYDCLLNKKHIENVGIMIDEIIKYFFPAIYSKDNMIPYEFMFTPIGNVLFSILYNKDKILSVSDVIELSKKITPDGFTRPYIIQEIKAGNLNADKISGVWKLSEREVYNYLEKKKKKKKKKK